MSNTKCRILLDLDDVLSVFIPSVLNNYNKINGTDFDISVINKWEIPDCLPNFWDALTSELLQNIPLQEGVKETLKKWHEQGHDIFIVTGILDDNHYLDKIIWLDNMGIKEYITDIIATIHKYIISGDTFVDDNVDNLRKWKQSNPNSLALLYTAQHNKDKDYSDEFIRINNWRELDLLIDVLSRK